MSCHKNWTHFVSNINTWSLYTLFKYRLSGKIVAKRGQWFDNVQRAVYFNQRNRGVDKMPSFAKETLEKKVQKPFMELLPKDKINANNWITIGREIRISLKH